MRVVIRFADESLRDLDLELDPGWTLATLKQCVRAQRGLDKVRFVRNGRWLTNVGNVNGTASGNNTDFSPGSVQSSTYTHSYSNNDVSGSSKVPGTSGSQFVEEPIFIHCIALPPDAPEDPEPVRTPQASGFDRLRALGLTEQEIELMREQFRATHGDNRELEDQWMDTGVSNSVPIANRSHNVDLLIGLSVGFLTGVFGLLLMRTEGLFSRRQRMAIFAGVITNLLFALMR